MTVLRSIFLALTLIIASCAKHPGGLPGGEGSVGEVQSQVKICHIPPGNEDNKHTITVPEAAMDAHLAHGDYKGECLGDSDDSGDDEDSGGSGGSGSQTGGTIVISGGASTTSTAAVTLTLNSSGASQMYITNISGCTYGGSWETYSTSKSWILGRMGRATSVYVKFKDASGAQSSCVSDSITHSFGCSDTSFGSNGYYTLPNVGGNPSLVTSLGMQEGCKFIVGAISNSVIGDQADFLVGRVSENATLDTSFGTSGWTKTNIHLYDALRALAVQNTGKIVGVGYKNGGYFGMVKYLTSGLLDTSFGTSGISTATGGASEHVVFQLNGDLLVSRGSGISRFTSLGEIDTAFGISGSTVAIAHVYYGQSFQIQDDGKLVAAATYSSGGSVNLAAVRFNYDGSLDTNFGTSGIAATSLSRNFGAHSLAIQSDGKIVVAGNSGGAEVALARFSSEGQIDTSFGSSGVAIASEGIHAIGGVVVQSDGKIIAVGGPYMTRFNSNGTIDTSFGSSGRVTFGSTVEHENVMLQADGKIVVGLYNSSPRIVRYKTNGTLDVP